MHKGLPHWWMLDLGVQKPIMGLDIQGRSDCCTEQSNDLTIYVGDVLTTPSEVIDLDGANVQMPAHLDKAHASTSVCKTNVN
jgi:hypothetical protein